MSTSIMLLKVFMGAGCCVRPSRRQRMWWSDSPPFRSLSPYFWGGGLEAFSWEHVLMSKMQWGEFQPMLWFIRFLLCFHLLASFELLEQVFLCCPAPPLLLWWEGCWKDGYEVAPDRWSQSTLTDKFTDSAIAMNSKVNGEHKEKVLQRWEGGDSNSDDYDLESDMVQSLLGSPRAGGSAAQVGCWPWHHSWTRELLGWAERNLLLLPGSQSPMERYRTYSNRNTHFSIISNWYLLKFASNQFFPSLGQKRYRWDCVLYRPVSLPPNNHLDLKFVSELLPHFISLFKICFSYLFLDVSLWYIDPSHCF